MTYRATQAHRNRKRWHLSLKTFAGWLAVAVLVMAPRVSPAQSCTSNCSDGTSCFDGSTCASDRKSVV